MEGSVAPLVPAVDECPPQDQHFNKGVVVVDAGYLEGIVAILLVDHLVDGKPLLQNTDHLVKTVGGYRPQHAVGLGVGEHSLVLVVPGDELLEEGVGTKQEGVGGIPGKLRQVVVQLEGQPLAGTKDGGPGQDLVALESVVKHSPVPLAYYITIGTK